MIDELTHIARAAAALGDELAGKAIRDRLHEIEQALKHDEDPERRALAKADLDRLFDRRNAA